MNMDTRDDAARIAGQAADWIDGLAEDGAGPAQFFDWLKTSPRHVEETLFVAALSAQARMLSQEQADELMPDLKPDSGLANVTVLHETAPQPPAPAAPRHWRRAGAIAASIAVAVLSWLGYSTLTGPQTYATEIGEQKTVALEDGSIVYLNTQTRLEVRLTAQERALRLVEGEALFVVKKDSARPFTVRTADTRVRALGTQFNVQRRSGDTQVAVVEGLVQVGDDTRLSAGEGADVSRGRILRQGPIDAGRTLAWRQRRLVFEDDTLADVAREFNRYNSKISLWPDAAAATERFTGTFDADAPETFLAAVTAGGELQAQRGGGGRITIRRRAGASDRQP